MSELVVVEKQDVMTVFTEDQGLDPILAKIAKEVRSVVADVKTAKGRDTIRSTAYKVAQSKTYLDDLGKALVADMKELPKKVDAHRKAAREFLESLQSEIRQPLTEWEAEQARIKAEQEAAAEAAALAIKIENDHEVGLLLNAEFDRQAAARKEAEAQAKREHEQRIAQEAAERAKKEAEEAAAREREAAQKRETDLRVAAELAEQSRLKAIADAEAAAAKAEQDKKDAEARAAQALKDAEERAERERRAAIEAERQRVAAAEEKERAEQAARDADKAHKARVNTDILNALKEHAALTEDQAKAVVVAVAKALIPNCKITY